MGVPTEMEEVQPSETPFESDLPLLLPPPPKKATRQWAAWTRQEEENFFNALRQVGKNFEKITCRVQSKNKDQVRHYYYRLVRRMNKLLGPGFSLDAKNSKDTIAAMLRWWSLLEKYSCTASKLHLKPRRFKTFIEALAHQLLKDRNKTNRRKRPSHEETYSFIPATSASVVTKGSSGNDVRPVKLIFLDNQKLQKLGYAKANSSKGNVDTSSKAGFIISKPMKQSKRTGLIASAAYKRWEKAAVAGVSLVADAAEELERTNSDGIAPNKRGTVDTLHGRDPVREDMSFAEATVHPLSSHKSDLPDSHNNSEMFLQPFAKLKLQLFPVDEITRKALEKDNHNPFLELTLSARKRVPSILEHLNRKWGHSEIASGELLLLPYGIQVDDLASCQKWTTRDGALSAADVYIALGRPNMFRLRYAWLPNSDIGSEVTMRSGTTFGSSNGLQPSIGSTDEQAKNIIRSHEDEPPKEEIPLENSNVAVVSQVASTYNVHLATMKPMSSSSLAQGELPHGRKSKVEEDRQRSKNISILSPGDWADSLTNISIGDLLTEASRSQDSIHVQPGDGANTGVPFSCDSFDAAIAAHLSGYNDLRNVSKQSSPESIWDAEETCDGFLFKNNSSQCLKDQRGSLVSSNGPFKEITQTNRSGFRDLLDNVAKIKPSDVPREREVEVGHEAIKEDVRPSHDKYDTGNNIGFMDIYWPDSLGTLDLEIPSSRCLGQDMILGDSISLNGLSRLIANSLDAFQNHSFIGSDKRPPAANEALEKNSPLGEVDNK